MQRQVLSIRFNEDERKALDALAVYYGVTRGEVVRRLVTKEYSEKVMRESEKPNLDIYFGSA